MIGSNAFRSSFWQVGNRWTHFRWVLKSLFELWNPYYTENLFFFLPNNFKLPQIHQILLDLTLLNVFEQNKIPRTYANFLKELPVKNRNTNRTKFQQKYRIFLSRLLGKSSKSYPISPTKRNNNENVSLEETPNSIN